MARSLGDSLRHVGLIVAAWLACMQATSLVRAQSAATPTTDRSTLTIRSESGPLAEAGTEQPGARSGQPGAVPTPAPPRRPTPPDDPTGAPPSSGTPTQPSASSDPGPEAPSASASASGSGGEASGQSASGVIRPVPDPGSGTSIPVEPASFNGVTPGVTTREQLEQHWGAPAEVAKQGGMVVHRYRVEPFDQVEVSLFLDKVQAIVIRLGRTFPAEHVAKQLELSAMRPVLVSNEFGEILGQCYPERGVLFGFQPADTPGKATMQVAQIILEPISAEAFVLRAETHLDSEPEQSAADLRQALQLDPANARAYWLYARVLASVGDLTRALATAQEAVRREPANAQYRITEAQILSQTGHLAEATAAAQRALQDSQKRPHIQARALCLLGDLAASGSKPDYKQALQYHTEAIKTADALVADKHPAIAQAAKEVLLEAYLGAAQDIAWGPWNKKDVAVPRWLAKAADLAERGGDGDSSALRLRVATRSLAACAGLQGQLDPTPWTEQTLTLAQQILQALRHPDQRRQVQWDVGIALYDAVQVYQMRGQHQEALRVGEKAVAFLEQGAALKQDSPKDLYLLGRLYFRLGAIHAIGKQNHQSAVAWFEKALPLLDATAERLAPSEMGRLGETLVLWCVSFWETNQSERALNLTQRGVQLMESAADSGLIDRAALEVPYSNLATMHRQLGHTADAEKFLQQAARAKGTVQR